MNNAAMLFVSVEWSGQADSRAIIRRFWPRLKRKVQIDLAVHQLARAPARFSRRPAGVQGGPEVFQPKLRVLISARSMFAESTTAVRPRYGHRLVRSVDSGDPSVMSGVRRVVVGDLHAFWLGR